MYGYVCVCACAHNFQMCGLGDSTVVWSTIPQGSKLRGSTYGEGYEEDDEFIFRHKEFELPRDVQVKMFSEYIDTWLQSSGEITGEG